MRAMGLRSRKVLVLCRCDRVHPQAYQCRNYNAKTKKNLWSRFILGDNVRPMTIFTHSFSVINIVFCDSFHKLVSDVHDSRPAPADQRARVITHPLLPDVLQSNLHQFRSRRSEPHSAECQRLWGSVHHHREI
jgi:hypothetical protein